MCSDGRLNAASVNGTKYSFGLYPGWIKLYDDLSPVFKLANMLTHTCGITDNVLR